MQLYPNYSIQSMQNQENNIRTQIDGLNRQLQQMQNIRNQMIQNTQPEGYSVSVVDNFDSITANSVPMENGAFFILKDGKEIQYRHWNGAGQILKTSYFPQIENKTDNVSSEEEKSKIEVSDEFTDTLNNLIERVEKIEQSLKPKRRTKKDGVEDDEQKSDDK